ncbi:MAG: hypothetical protein ACYC8T_23770 [Myxococcaceae bacterium]
MKLWLAVTAAAALLLAVAAGLLLLSRSKAPRPAPIPVAPAACTVPEVVPMRVMAGAEAPPIILWAAGPVRTFVDGAPAFSAPEAPMALPTGEHTLTLEAPGAEPLTTRFRVVAFTPALFHAQLDKEVGITLARLGTACASCDEALSEVKLTPEKSRERPAALLAKAAGALRRDDWRTAAASLRGVPAAQRRSPLFRRLAAGVYSATAQPSRAREELAAIGASRSSDLGPLLGRIEALTQVERERQKQVVLARWNRVTERFGHLVDRFERVVPGPVTSASGRMAELSKSFTEATRQGDVTSGEAELAAAEQTLSTLAAQLRASRPLDCAFQTDVVQTLLR